MIYGRRKSVCWFVVGPFTKHPSLDNNHNEYSFDYLLIKTAPEEGKKPLDIIIHDLGLLKKFMVVV